MSENNTDALRALANADYFNKLRAMIKEKDLETFWVMCDRAAFKPMKNMDAKKVKQHLAKNATRLAGQKIASVTLHMRGLTAGANAEVFTVKIIVFEISDDGKINQSKNDNWGLMFHYKLDELKELKFTLKLLHKLVQLCADQVLTSDTFNGISLKAVRTKLARANVDLDAYSP